MGIACDDMAGLAAAVRERCKQISRTMPRDVLAARLRLEARRFMHDHPAADLYLIDGGRRHEEIWRHGRPPSLSKECRAERRATPNYDRLLALDDRAESYILAAAGHFLAGDDESFRQTARRGLERCDPAGIGSALWTWVALFAAKTGQTDVEMHSLNMVAESGFVPLRIVGLLNGILRAQMYGRDEDVRDFANRLNDEDHARVQQVYGLVREMNVRRQGEERILECESWLRQSSLAPRFGELVFLTKR